MRNAVILLAVAAATAYAQDTDRLCRAVVEVQTTDRALELAQALRRDRAPIARLRELKIHQPYTMVVTGVCISPREILTPALHPRADLRIVVTYHDGRVAEASVKGNDPLSNLALVEVEADSPDFVTLRAGEVVANQSVRMAGFPADCSDRKPCLVAGQVGSEHVSLMLRDFYGVTGGKGYFVLGSAFAVGSFEGRPNIGCACLDDEGNLVGLVIGGGPPRLVPDPDRPGQLRALEVRFAVPAARIARVVDDFRRHGHVVRAYFGIVLDPVEPALRAQFDLPKSACAVSHTARAGPAAAAGLRQHDVVVSLDGQSYRDMYELGEAMSEKTPGEPVVFEVLRRGQRVKLEATPTREP